MDSSRRGEAGHAGAARRLDNDIGPVGDARRLEGEASPASLPDETDVLLREGVEEVGVVCEGVPTRGAEVFDIREKEGREEEGSGMLYGDGRAV